MSRTLWDVVVEIARGVDAGHAIWHGVPVREVARRAEGDLRRRGAVQEAGGPPEA